MTLPELDMRARALARTHARRMMQLTNGVYAANAATTSEIKNGARALKALLKQLEKQANG
jgi:hypothetical protein